MEIILAIIFGGLFGFVLHKAGAANPQNIINMLRLQDLHLMKVILFAIGFSSLILFILLNFGLIDNSHISIKSSYVGVIIGGLIFGLGFAIGGYCPGTSIVALGSGRRDALFFILGGLLGAFLFTLSYGSQKDTFLFGEISAGKVTLAATGVSKYPALFENLPGVIVAGVIAAVFMLVAWKLPSADR
jgi:uncharacterized membrane protein YedE/YeeE